MEMPATESPNTRTVLLAVPNKRSRRRRLTFVFFTATTPLGSGVFETLTMSLCFNNFSPFSPGSSSPWTPLAEKTPLIRHQFWKKVFEFNRYAFKSSSNGGFIYAFNSGDFGIRKRRLIHFETESSLLVFF